MTNPRDIFIQEFDPIIESKQDKPGKFRAVLTNNLGATDAGSVWQDESARLVWFRAWASAAPAWALCDVIEPTLGLGVWIKFNDDIQLYEVIQDDPTQRNPDSNRSAYRAPTNEDFEKGGKFQLWLDPTLFIPISVYPTGSDTVNVVSGDYIYQGERKTFAGEVNLDLSGSRPAAGLHRLVGIYLDSSNTIQTVDGATIATGSDAAEPTWPDGAFRVAVVDLDNSTDISIDDIYNRKVIYTEDEGLGKGAWPNPGVVHRWDVSSGLTIIEDDLPTAVSNAADGDTIALGIGTYTLTSQLSTDDDIAIIGPPIDRQNQNWFTEITGAVANGLISINTAARVSLSNLAIINSGSSGNEHGVVVENGRGFITDCYISGSSSGGNADGVRCDSTSGTTRLYLYDGWVENSASGTGYAVNAAVHSSNLEVSIFGTVLTGDDADINAVANTEVYLYDAVLATPSINGAGAFFGEVTDFNGVRRYVGDITPSDNQFPKWDTDEWIPGYVDELWESDAGAVAWATDAAGKLESQGGELDLNGIADALILDSDGDTTISAPTDDQIDFEVGGNDRATIEESGITIPSRVLESFYPLDQELVNTYSDSVISHFRDNDSSYPAGWTESDAADTTNTNSEYSFWRLQGRSTETSWKYRVQTSIDLENDVAASTFLVAYIGPIYYVENAYTADVDYYFGIYRNNAGIDEDTFSRVHLQYDSAGTQWRVRGQNKDVTSGTQHDGSWTVLYTPGSMPIHLTCGVREDTHRAIAGLVQIWPFSNTWTQNLFAQNPTNSLTYGDVWIQFEMSRGAGVPDNLYIGALDLQ